MAARPASGIAPVSDRLCGHAVPHPSGPAVAVHVGELPAVNGAKKEVSTSDEDTAILTVDAAWFYRAHWAREAVFWTLCLMTAFTLRLLLSWNDDWHVWLRYIEVKPDDPRAQYVLVRDLTKRHALVPILFLDTTTGTWRTTDSYRGRRAAGSRADDATRRFDWRNERFYYDGARSQWTRIVYDTHQPYAELQRRGAAEAWEAYRREGDAAAGDHERDRRQLTYGSNKLDIEPRPLWLLMLDELLKPFFAFQVFSIIVWFTQAYNVYAYTILGMSVFAITQTAVTTWFNQRALQRLAETETPVNRFALRPAAPVGSGLGELPAPPPIPASVPDWSSHLLPGDLIVISAGLTVPCDVVILTGSCVVNEAMLTGESAPVLKVAIPTQADHVGADAKVDRFSVGHDKDNKYMLFSGTRIVQARQAAQAPFAVNPFISEAGDGGRGPTTLWQFARDQAVDALRQKLTAARPDISPEQIGRVVAAYRSQWVGQHRLPVVAMVAQTSFATAKGQLIRAILYPKPARFDFQRQSYNFIFILMLATLSGCLATIGYSVERGLDAIDVFKRCLNLITVTIPPALPLALSIGLSAALLRTQDREVYCTSPPRLTNAGRVNCLCFDKTGTLTEEGLTLHGVTGLAPAPPPASTATKAAPTSRLAMGTLEHRIQPLYRNSAARPAALALYDTDVTEALEPEDLAASLRLALVHVLAGCHSLSLLEADTAVAADPAHPLSTAAVPSPGLASASTLTLHDPVKAAGDDGGIAAAESSGEGLQGGRALLLGKTETSYGTAKASPPSQATPESAHSFNDGTEPDGVLPADGLGASRARFVGDPLEVQMFLSTGWSFAVRPEADDSEAPIHTESSPSASMSMAFNSSDALGVAASVDVLVDGAGATARRTNHGAGDILPPCDDPLTVSAVWSWPGLPRHVDTLVLPSRVLLAGPAAARTALAVLRRFDFDPALRRMSVLVQHVPLDAVHAAAESPSGRAVRAALLCKGAPESIKDACLPSTVPADFDATLHRLAVAGFRVLACAVRPLRASAGPAQAATTAAWLKRPRAELERDLYFAGFLVMENRLKATTAMHLDTYIRSGLRCIMVTGDNPLTAAAVAKRCGPYFLRPTRRTWLLEAAASAKGQPKRGKDGEAADGERPEDREPALSAMLMRDMEDQDVVVDFGVFLRERLPGVAVTVADLTAVAGAPGATTTSPLTPAGRLADDVDLVVTGPAYFALMAHHDAVMDARKAAASAEAAERSAGSRAYRVRSSAWLRWRPWTTKKARQDAFARLEGGRDGLGPDGLYVTPLQLVLHRANIFARMSPQNKQELMGSLQDLGYVVCMTGDGANDSGALKAADVGISIQASPSPHPPAPKVSWLEWVETRLNNIGWSSNEDKKARTQAAAQAAMSAAPSIAAPFSTQLADIGVVRIVLTEGRACLVTTFSMFQYMFCYGVIQFTSVLVLYRSLLELADYQYLWSDMGLVFPLVLTIPLMRAEPRLSRGRPEADLLAPSVWRSVLGLLTLIVVFQVAAAEMLISQPWYQPPAYDDENFNDTYTIDSSCAFLFANFQYVIVAMSLAQSYGVFRERIVQNLLLSLTFLVQLVVISIMLLLDSEGLDAAFSIIYTQPDFAWKLWGLAMANGLAFILFQRFFVPHMSPDEEPFDVDAVIKELPPPSTTRVHVDDDVDDHRGRSGGCARRCVLSCCVPPNPDDHANMVSAATPDAQLTLLPRMRWRTPHYVVVEKVASPVWSAMPSY